eukprot:TRINITY_DN149_c0_g1_i1.p1 TRINITY_DN149_c0_g1~~TRINITY_DN149_c0_g1_i1.p1  ORF type:complete len:120 (+),score=16.90 TRINITY_DN149_c0_g1_i1:344-703(+)
MSLFKIKPETNANFCYECGTLLDMPTVGIEIICDRCKSTCLISDFSNKTIVSTSKKHTAGLKQTSIDDGDDRPISTNETCQQCGCNQIYYSMFQLRSADEGQTIFYECVDCRFIWSVNN